MGHHLVIHSVRKSDSDGAGGAARKQRGSPRLRWGGVIALLTASVLISADVTQDEGEANQPFDEERLYRQFCSSCHARRGQGSGFGPSLLTSTVGRLSDRELRLIITAGNAAKGMPAFEYGLKDGEIEALVSYIRKLQGIGRQGGQLRRKARTSPPDRQSPEAARGQDVFFGKGRCISCHSLLNIGGLHGPNLTVIGKRMSQGEIYESIAFPSKEIAKGFGAKTIKTRKGKTINGRYRNETPETIQLLDEEQELWTTYFKKNLRSVSSKETSTMPDDLLQRLEPGEIQDLLAYLYNLKPL